MSSQEAWTDMSATLWEEYFKLWMEVITIEHPHRHGIDHYSLVEIGEAYERYMNG